MSDSERKELADLRSTVQSVQSQLQVRGPMVALIAIATDEVFVIRFQALEKAQQGATASAASAAATAAAAAAATAAATTGTKIAARHPLNTLSAAVSTDRQFSAVRTELQSAVSSVQVGASLLLRLHDQLQLSVFRPCKPVCRSSRRGPQR
jgi:hypothetical protein